MVEKSRFSENLSKTSETLYFPTIPPYIDEKQEKTRPGFGFVEGGAGCSRYVVLAREYKKEEIKFSMIDNNQS